MEQKQKNKIVKRFIRKYKKRGYTEVSVKEDPIIPETYIVSAIEPLAKRQITTHLRLPELQR